MKKLIEFTLKNRERIEEFSILWELIEFYKANGFEFKECYVDDNPYNWEAELVYEDQVLYEESGCSCYSFRNIEIVSHMKIGKRIVENILGEIQPHLCKEIKENKYEYNDW